MFAFLEKLKIDLFAKSDHATVPPADPGQTAAAAKPPATPDAAVNPALADLGHMVQLFNPFASDAEPGKAAATPATPATSATAATATIPTDQLIKNALALKSSGLSDAEVLSYMDPSRRADIAQALSGNEAEIETAAHEARDVKPGGEFQAEKLAHIKDPEMRSQVRAEIVAEELIDGAQDGKFDQAKVIAALEKIENPTERVEALKKFHDRTGENLDKVVADNVDSDRYASPAIAQLLSPNRDVAQNTLDALPPEQLEEKMDKARVEARAIGAAIFRKDKDKTSLFKLMQMAKPEDIEALRRAFNEVYPGQNGLFNSLNWALSGDSEREAIADLDQSPDARRKSAAAAMANAFTGFGHANDRGRMKEILGQLSKEDLDAMRANPDEYGDIMNKVANTMHGVDAPIVAAYISGDKALGDGLQLAQDIGSDQMEMIESGPGEQCGKKDFEALFQKLEAMPLADRRAAMLAYNQTVGQQSGTSIQDLMRDRFDHYNGMRGAALLAGTEDGELDAKAAQAEEAVVHRGTDTKNLEAALTDKDLALRGSDKPEDQKKYAAAVERRHKIEDKVAEFDEGKGSLINQINDEDKLEDGKVDRIALNQILDNGELSKGMQLKRYIDDDNTGKAKELMLGWSTDDRNAAVQLFADNKEKWGTLPDALNKEWGPKKDIGMGLEVEDKGGEESSEYYQMSVALAQGGRQNWSPATLANVDERVHDQDREVTMDELLDKTRAGQVYDQSLAVELRAKKEGETGKEFNEKAENTQAASENYAKQREDDAEEFVKSLKLVATICTAILAPELLPLVGPLMSAIAIDYKEHKLGAHYEGENEDKHDLKWEVIESIVTIGVTGAVELKEAASIKKIESEVAAAKGLVADAKALEEESAFLEQQAAAAGLRPSVAELEDAKAAEQGGKAATTVAADAEDPDALKFLADQKDAAMSDADKAKLLKSEFGEVGKAGEGAVEAPGVTSGVSDVEASTADAEKAMKDTAAKSTDTAKADADLADSTAEARTPEAGESPEANQTYNEKRDSDLESYTKAKEAEIKSAQDAAKVQKLAATTTTSTVLEVTKGKLEGKDVSELIHTAAFGVLGVAAAEMGGKLMEKVLGKTTTFASEEQRAEQELAKREAEEALLRKEAEDKVMEADLKKWETRFADEDAAAKPPVKAGEPAAAEPPPGATPQEKLKANVDETLARGKPPETPAEAADAPKPPATADKATPEEQATAKDKLANDAGLKPDEKVAAATQAAGVDPTAIVGLGPLPATATEQFIEQWSITAMRSILIAFGKTAGETAVENVAGEGKSFEEVFEHFMEEMGENTADENKEHRDEAQIQRTLGGPV